MVHVVLLLLVAYGTDDLEGPHDTISYYGSYNSYGANGFTCLMNDLYDFFKGFYALGVLMDPMAILPPMTSTASMGP